MTLPPLQPPRSMSRANMPVSSPSYLRYLQYGWYPRISLTPKSSFPRQYSFKRWVSPMTCAQWMMMAQLQTLLQNRDHRF